MPTWPIAHSVASGWPSYYFNCRRLFTENVQYIRLTAAYLTTIRHVMIKVFYLYMKRLKMFVFTINCRSIATVKPVDSLVYLGSLQSLDGQCRPDLT